MHGDDYHKTGEHVYVGTYAFEVGALWESIDEIENSGITLDEIALALNYNWTATVVALALKNIATLRALIADARSVA